MKNMIPMGRIIRKKNLLSLLKSQFPENVKFGLKRISMKKDGKFVCDTYRVYTKSDKEDFSKSPFKIHVRRFNRLDFDNVLEYSVKGEFRFKLY